jgi:lipopolysaccharide export system permease protein
LKKLDAYIIKKYLLSFFFTTLLITMTAIVIDFSEKVGKFINESLGFKQIVLEYYLNFIPWINGLLWPLFSLIAVVFFTSRLAKNSEILSILGAGVSYWRMLVPYLVSASIIAGILWFNNNYVTPKSTRIKNNFENTYIFKGNKKVSNENVHFFLSPNEKAFVRYFRLRDTSLMDFRIESFEDGRLTKVLKAKRVKLKNHPDEWTMYDYSIRHIDGLRERLISGKGEQIDTTLGFSPDEFIRYSNEMESMTSAELRAYIAFEESKGLGKTKKYLIELYRRTADPFTIIILTLIGAAIASRKTRGGIGLHLALGVCIGAAFVITSKFSVTFATSHTLNPLIGIWLPNILFLAIALVLISRAQK